jgi:hypothetical protein
MTVTEEIARERAELPVIAADAICLISAAPEI